jgi:Predicted hydrolases or acyltransferases (alpha/beta hydrolase superfamily)
MDTDKRFELRCGRILGYAEYGDPTGDPLFFFHGFPGSRFEAMPLDDVFRRHRLRVIAPERPGLGLSTPARGWKILDWPDELSELADGLGIGSFSVCGISGGGPFSLACAWKMPERLASVTVIAGLGPLSEPQATEGMKEANLRAFKMALESPWKLRLVYFLARFVNLEKSRQKSLAKMREPDRSVMSRPEMQKMAALDAAAAMARRGRGLADHVALYARDWGFRLEDIEKEIRLWQGEEDVNVPPAMGRYQAAHLPRCVAHFLPGEGHFSLPFNQGDRIFEEASHG